MADYVDPLTEYRRLQAKRAARGDDDVDYGPDVGGDNDVLRAFRRRAVYDADRGIAGTQRFHDGMTVADRDKKIAALYKRGYSQQAIADYFGLTQQGISKALKRIAEGRPGRDLRG
ncbi:MAG: helix-turn-helix domain-containing protein [Mycobacterium sp.]